jgi:hypothetical protein
VGTDTTARRAVPLFGWLTSAAGLLVALATFDPHLTNFEFLSYLLRAFLPELIISLFVSLLFAAWRLGIFTLIARHRVLAILIIALIGWVTLGKIEQTIAKPPVDAAVDLGHFKDWSHTRVRFGAWRRLSSVRYSREQVRLFRTDMQMRAAQAVKDEHPSQARADLEAAKDAAGGYGDGVPGAQASLNYMDSRDRYIANIQSRLVAARHNAPLSPLTLYLIRAIASLLPGDANARQQADRYADRIRQAVVNADETFGGCAKGTAVGPTMPDAVFAISRLSETSGDFPGFLTGQNRREWCDSVRRILARHAQQTGETVEETTSESVAGFRQTADAIWGLEIWHKRPAPELGETDLIDNESLEDANGNQ